MTSSDVRFGSLLASSLLLLTLAAHAEAAGYGSTNLARGKTITPITGTVQGSPAGVTDGSYDGTNSQWYSLNCAGWSPCINQFTIDLGASYAIGKINVYALQTHQFRVLSSTDGTTWTERHKYNWITSSGFYLGGGSLPVTLRPDGSYSARYLKYEASADWYQYVGVYELEVYEWVANPPPEPSLNGLTNLALGKTVTGVTGFPSVSGHAPSLLTDGNVSTYWQGNYASDNCTAVYQTACPLATWYSTFGFAYIDLGELRDIRALKLRFPAGAAGAQSYLVSLTETDASWAKSNWVGLWGDPAMVASSPPVTSSGDHTFYLPNAVRARYVWVYMHTWATRGAFPPGLAEVEAYGAAGTQAGYGSTNLARGKAITPITGTVEGSPAGVTDGSYDGTNSLWYSLNCTGWSPCINQFTIDLGASYAIGKINVYPVQTHQFRVLSSTDGTTWTERHKYNWITSSGFYLGGGSPPVTLRPDGSYSARYLKYEASADWYQYVGVYELEVYEWVANPPPEPSLNGLTNLALGKTVTGVTDFPSVSGHAPSLLTDGNVSTYWQGNYASDQCSAIYQTACPLATWYSTLGFAYIDLGELRDIQALKLRFPAGAAGAESYLVSLTETDASWAKSKWVGLWGDPAMVASSPAVTTSGDHAFFLQTPVKVRYVWVYMHNWATRGPFPPGLAEVEVYGSGGAPTVPAPPTIGTATAGDSRVTVAFTPSTNDGGSAITGYTATCGARSASGPISPIVVTGLTNGTAVTCTVVATNAVGNSAASGASNSVTPGFTGTAIPRLVNISTRGLVATGDNIMIGGFIIGGSEAKKVLIRGRGPSMAALGVQGTLADPAIRLFNGATPTDFNDNWQTATNASEITASNQAPTDPREAAILTTVNPGVPYTVHLSGVSETSGIAIVEVFELDKPEVPLLNISTRGLVLTGDNVMIGGFIIQGDAAQQVLIIAKGPSLGAAPFNVPGSLPDPTLDLYQAGVANPIESNDNWGDSTNAAAIQATGNAPSNALESAIIRTLTPGAYTAIVRGKGAFQGIGLVEVYKK